MIVQKEIILPGFKKGFHLITRMITDALPDLPVNGLLNIFLQHTSAGLMINENADPSVPVDLHLAFDQLAPERLPFYTHTIEGDDDMPAHIKSALSGVSLSIPISDHRLKLGIWQGIFLCEYRNQGGPRKLTLTVFS